MKEKTTDAIIHAVERSPGGLARLEVMRSLRLCDDATLKTLLCRLGKDGRILRVKRGLYSANPIMDPFRLGIALFGGYLAFTSALYIHGLITEVPFEVVVATPHLSKVKTIGVHSYRAVAIAKKAVGFEQKGPYLVSTPAKTLYDCLALPRYSVGNEKLLEAFAVRGLSGKEKEEFRQYLKMFGRPKLPAGVQKKLQKWRAW